MMRKDTLLRAIDCPHQITDDAVVLHFDPSKPGHNALNQLDNRLCEKALSDDAGNLAEFEAWHAKRYGYMPVRVAAMNGLYKSHTSRVAWEAWQAAREKEKKTC